MTAQTTTKITNAREYQITLNAIRNLEQGLIAQETFRARRGLADLCQQVAAYNPADDLAYHSTLAAIRRFESYMQHLEEASTRLDPALLGTLRENTRSFLADLHTHAAACAMPQRRNT